MGEATRRGTYEERKANPTNLNPPGRRAVRQQLESGWHYWTSGMWTKRCASVRVLSKLLIENGFSIKDAKYHAKRTVDSEEHKPEAEPEIDEAALTEKYRAVLEQGASV